MGADYLFHSGRVFDGEQLLDGAPAVAVADGRIAAVGSDAEAERTAATQLVDLRGKLLLPAFTDAHIHPVSAGVERLGCDVSDAKGRDGVLARVADFAAASDGRWIVGGGWSMADFPNGTPAKELLDGIDAIGARPAVLVNCDHHSSWVNSEALRTAGIDASTPDPEGGRIERDVHGNPAGTLHEAAMQLVDAHAPAVTEADQAAALMNSQKYLQTLGIRGWQDAIIGDYAGQSDSTAVYQSAARAGTLTADVVGALWWPRGITERDIEDQADAFAAVRNENSSGRFRTTSVKIMLDGVAETFTAAMQDPYLDACGCAGTNKGISYFRPEILNLSVAALEARGFDVHMHAIGDRAVHYGLDAVEYARRAHGPTGRRHHLAHIQVIDPHDVPRFAQLDVTANAQALWAAGDKQMTDLTLPFLGPERSGRQYPFASLVRSGARLAMGSDWPVSTPDPWAAVHVAVNRREAGHPDAEPLGADQSIDLTTALAAYTRGSARLNRSDAGTVAAGAPADLAVASADPFTVHPADLHTLRNDMTMVGGEIVFAA
ncbi:amidohydrolase [Spelaeicoccus albus]|uniref:Amidohydrolase 3 domain-containing protein n=1 Tax=Spelaeicoccus albus TaxID=1280376 RepID=A0A7Z0D1L9_9MICO|nr:amidohydrolase [Spelaeicoccus albus]NYI66310.1 hypothetical protein [Spelaeicoccus albus]